MELTLQLGLRVIAVVWFAAAAVADLRTRTVPNAIWVILLAIGAFGLWADGFGPVELAGVAIVVATVSAGAITAFARGWIGGADAKALMLIPVVFPRVPTRDIWTGVLGPLLQGFEVVIVVFTVAGLVGLAWQLALSRASDRRRDRGVPFLVPVCVSVVALFVA